MKAKFPKRTLILAALFAAGLSHPIFAATTNVSFGFTFFNPKVVVIRAGDTVVWSNTGGSHTVTGTGSEAMCGSATVPTSCSRTFPNVGSFPYQCNVPGHASAGMTGLVMVVAAPTPPAISLASPTNGTIYAAPANIKLAANATSSSGSVTNVQFFGNSTSLGSTNTPPFTITSVPLGAGSYALTARATDNSGLSTTSSIVNVSVITPVAISNFFPRVANGQFTFSHTANPGLRYVVENSTNLSNWSSLVTNTAVGGTVTNSFPVSIPRFYRVGRLPNP